MGLADPHAGVEAVEAGHAHVEQNEVVRRLAQHLERFLARLRTGALEAVLREHVEQGPSDVGIVVDHEDARGIGGGRAEVAGPWESH